MSNQDSDVKVETTVRKYWRAYGGLTALLESKYLYVAVALTLAAAPTFHDGELLSSAVSILSSLVGFSLAALALLFSYGDAAFIAFLATVPVDGDGSSSNNGTSDVDQSEGTSRIYVLERIAAKFAHFIFVQAGTLTIAVVCPILKKHYIPEDYECLVIALHAVATLGFFYSLMLTFATVVNLFELTHWYRIWNTDEKK